MITKSSLNIYILLLFIIFFNPFIFCEWFFQGLPLVSIRFFFLLILSIQLIRNKLYTTKNELIFICYIFTYLSVELYINKSSNQYFVNDVISILFFIVFYLIKNNIPFLESKMIKTYITLLILMSAMSLASLIVYKLAPFLFYFAGYGNYNTYLNPLLGFIHESNLSSRPSWFFAEPSYLGFYLGLNITFINDYIKQKGYNKNKRIIFMFIYFISCISIGSNTLYVALTLSFIISFFEKIKYISYNIYTNIIIVIIAIILIILPTLDFFSLYLEFEAVQNSSMGDRQSRIISSSVIMQDMNLKDYIIGMGSSTVEILTGKGESNVYYKLFVEQGIVSIILYIYFIKNQFKHCPLYVFTYIILAFNATIVHFMPLTFFNIFALSSFYNNKIQKNRYD